MAKNGVNKVEASSEKRKRADEDEYSTTKKQKYQGQQLEILQSNDNPESLFLPPVSVDEESEEPHLKLKEEDDMEDDDENVSDNFDDDDDSEDDEEDDDEEEKHDSDYANSDVDDYWSLL